MKRIEDDYLARLLRNRIESETDGFCLLAKISTEDEAWLIGERDTDLYLVTHNAEIVEAVERLSWDELDERLDAIDASLYGAAHADPDVEVRMASVLVEEYDVPKRLRPTPTATA